MTSEAPHRPGQEPGEVSPGAGGPAPYGDHPAQQDNGYPNAPDLGWAPPPPAGRPSQPAPAWAGQDDQSPAPAWAQPVGQPPNPAWGAAQVPQQTEPDAWAGSPQPAWAAPEQAGPAWAAASAPGANPTTPPEQPSPAWATPEQAGPAWAAGPGGDQPAWAQAADQSARGAAQVPAGQSHDDPARSGGWATTQQQDDPARSGGWNTAPATQDGRSGGWPVGTGAQQQDDPARSGGWTSPPQDDQPAWGQQGEQSAPAWASAAPTARAAAQVPAPAGQPNEAWGTSNDPNRSGGWPAGNPEQDDPARSGGWAAGVPARQDEAEPARGWSAPQQDNAGGWETGPRDDDPDRSGGWAAGRAATHGEPAQQPGWGAPDDQRPATGWSGAAAVPQQQDRPASEESAQAGPWGAAAPAQDDRPEAGGWTPPEPSPARATASVPSPDGPPAWGANQDDAPQWTRGDRPAVPDAEPWPASEVWGRSAEAEPAAPQSNGWESGRAEEPAAYQPAPGPGISPGNAVPLPPQEQRVPGASLAASPPADYRPPAQFAPAAEAPAEPAGRDPQAYESEQSGAVPGWGPAEASHQEPQSPAGPVVPAPRISPEAGAVSASASVPLASRVMPPTDQAVRPAGSPAPQPRVYGRPTRPEPEEATGQDAPNGYPEQGGQRFDEPGQQSGFDDQGQRPDDRGQQPRYDDQSPQSGYDDQGRPAGPHGFAEAQSAPPSSPAGPPPFPPGVPSFVDPAANHRPANGVHPHNGERPDPFGGPGGHAGPGDPYGSPGQGDPYGGPGHNDPFGGQGGPAGGRASVGVPGQGPGAMHEQGPGGFPPAFPPPPQQAPPAWQQGLGGEPEQGRFDAFKPDAEPKTEAPAPKVRNGRVLALVLIAAVLILAVPLGLLTLLGKVGGDDKPAGFDPAVGSCVKQSGAGAVAANCGEQGAFTVVSKVDAQDKCGDPTQPHVVLPGEGTNRVLCLKPAGK
ncbi:hypothetical protein EV384_0932 [Micromonospora kangleipakensis]|uniref:Uncharacterized protein n=1 Tax=Micromonospora kangleipakensis TaxID=1077942 RepID=A0A4Q8B686_9ACTN|nr:hypothetical protein [Micromonospora kangleipakensis]RZU72561.1 hypothetical protein EV384_0932 [Micromonospora kangleipakensis]